MKDGGTEKKVLVLGGGYDERLDGSTSRMSQAADGSSILGNAVYIVDAETGLPLWSLNNDNADANMRYAIPADINVIDGDMDGLADRLYFGDLGGQIWRIDFPDGDLGNSSAVSVNRLAELGTDTSFQPFFYTPSVALISTRVDNYLAIAVGSGSRDNPLNPASDNHIYMLKDKNTDAGAPVDVTDWPYIATDLHDASLNLIGSSDNAIAQAAYDELKLAAGWLMKLQQGEKALSETTIFQDELLFTTYTPTSDSASASDPCAVAGSIGRFYRMDVRDARPVDALSQSGDGTAPLTAADRSSTISTHGIPGPATIVFPKNSESVDIYVGQNKVSEISQRLTRVLWYNQ